MKIFINRIINKCSILSVVFIIGSMLAACTASEKTSGEKGSIGGTEQTKSANADNKQAENKSAEDKKPAEKEVLWDFKKADNSKPQTFPKAETDAVLKYLLDTDTWDKDLAITSRVQGAFTKPNAKETLYYVSGCKDESGKFVSNATCGHVGWDSAAWIAVFDGTTPVLKIEKALGYSIGKITDVNGDGKNEFLSFAGYAQSGTQTEGVSIGQISDGKYENIKGFNGYAYNCAFGGGKSPDELSARAAVISYTPTTDGKMPEFSEEYFQAKCKADDSGSAFDLIDQSSWKKITKKEFDEFFDSLS